MVIPEDLSGLTTPALRAPPLLFKEGNQFIHTSYDRTSRSMTARRADTGIERIDFDIRALSHSSRVCPRQIVQPFRRATLLFGRLALFSIPEADLEAEADSQ